MGLYEIGRIYKVETIMGVYKMNLLITSKSLLSLVKIYKKMSYEGFKQSKISSIENIKLISTYKS